MATKGEKAEKTAAKKSAAKGGKAKKEKKQPEQPKTNPDVMAMVEARINADPNVSAKALKPEAEQIDPTIADLTNLQFHARYVLQVKAAKTRGAA